MKLQVLCICCDHICIRNTILTWSCATRIVVLANGPNTEQIISNLKDIKNCFVIKGEFSGFSNTRNLLINLSQTQNYDYNIFCDDSYELRGDIIAELEKQKLNHGLIHIKSGNFWQNRKLIFKRGKYSGRIHETLIDDGVPFQLENCYIEDIIYSHHLKRTYLRINYDLEMLDKEPDNRRTRYYRGTLLLKKGKLKESLNLLNGLLDEKDQYFLPAKKCCDYINECI